MQKKDALIELFQNKPLPTVDSREIPSLVILLFSRVQMNSAAESAIEAVTLDDAFAASNRIRYAFRSEHLVLERASACGIALILDKRARIFRPRIVAICSTDNIDPDTFLDIVRKH